MISRFVCAKMRCSSTNIFKRNKEKPKKRKKKAFLSGGLQRDSKVFAILFDTTKTKHE